jgi:hypothetical protein
LYSYVLNNPLLYTDPTGLVSYILYDPNFHQGDNNKKIDGHISGIQNETRDIYGTRATTINTGRWTAESFEAWWNGLSGDIESIHIIGHGTPERIAFDDKYYGQFDHLGIFHYITTDNVSNLNPIDIDMLVLWGCNNGHLDQNNLAMAFTDVVGNGRVIAADGATSFNVERFDTGLGFMVGRFNYSLSVITARGFSRFRPDDSNRSPSGFVAFYQENGEMRHTVLGVGNNRMTPREFVRQLYDSSRDYYNTFGY